MNGKDGEEGAAGPPGPAVSIVLFSSSSPSSFSSQLLLIILFIGSCRNQRRTGTPGIQWLPGVSEFSHPYIEYYLHDCIVLNESDLVFLRVCLDSQEPQESQENQELRSDNTSNNYSILLNRFYNVNYFTITHLQVEGSITQ